ncbi:MAG: hypothetical protein H6625_00450 [Bdellovibrionaceae bacterium]|nr:hypothetical protein [Pseudobdellovibrionaceae bacterium]
MGEFFATKFSQEIKPASQKTSRFYQGQNIHQVVYKVGELQYIKNGDHSYLDNLHKNHIEVFNKTGKYKYCLNLDGSINCTSHIHFSKSPTKMFLTV